MNKKKWLACKSAAKLTIKLAEETGEVAKAHLDVLEATNAQSREHRKGRLIVELGHVKFIAECLEQLVKAEDTDELERRFI